MLALMSSGMGEVVLQSLRGSGALPHGVTTPSLADVPQDILFSLKVADSVMPLWGTCGTPCLSAPSLPICVPSGPADAESHRNLHRHGAANPGSLILHLFSIRPVPCVLTSLLLVLCVSGFIRPAPCDFSLVRFLPWWSTPGCESL